MRRSFPVTTFLIVANLIGFAWELTKTGFGLIGGSVTLQSLADAGAIVPIYVTQNGEYWRLVSGAFLHGGLFHLAVNMFSLYVLGRIIESIGGSMRMAVIYVVSMIVSGLAVAWFSGPTDVTVGASGAIFGLFGALFAMGFKLGPPGMAMVRANIGILVINLAITFFVPGIAMWAHIGGLIIGFVVAYVIFFPPKPVRASVVDAATGAEIASEYEAPEPNRNG